MFSAVMTVVHIFLYCSSALTPVSWGFFYLYQLSPFLFLFISVYMCLSSLLSFMCEESCPSSVCACWGS